MKSFKEYLKKAKALNLPRSKAIVMGNVSADMDSVVGSMAMSWCYGLKADAPQYSPLINCSRDELKMRIEIV